MKPLKAIAAMSLNRVIGRANTIPWHLPEDFKWFKKMTTGHVLVMGRKTFESIGKPLPNRTNVVLTRSGVIYPGTVTRATLLEVLQDEQWRGREIFVCGGAQVYEQALPFCSDLYLTLVKQTIDGDAFFPAFEDRFDLVGTVADTPEFAIRHYRARSE